MKRVPSIRLGATLCHAKTMPTMQVPLLDLKPQYASLKTEALAAIEKVCASQGFILGAEVTKLEKDVAAYSQCQYGIGVSSGTDALLLALMALDIGPGHEVITSPYTFSPPPAPSRAPGRDRPSATSTRRLQPGSGRGRDLPAEGCEMARRGAGEPGHRRHIKALMPVHLYGQVADMQPLLILARRHGLKVIEDAAQAIGAADAQGRRAGSLGDIGCLSFFPTKNLGAFGDAGMCVTQDAELAERMTVLRVHGGKPKYYHALIGGNFRIDELQAAVLNVKLPHLDAWTAARQRNAAFYDSAFAGARLGAEVRTPPPCRAAGISTTSM